MQAIVCTLLDNAWSKVPFSASGVRTNRNFRDSYPLVHPSFYFIYLHIFWFIFFCPENRLPIAGRFWCLGCLKYFWVIRIEL